MTTATRRLIARICIVICVALVAFAAAAFTFGLGHLTFAGVLRIDAPAIVSIIFARLYLHSSAARRG